MYIREQLRVGPSIAIEEFRLTGSQRRARTIKMDTFHSEPETSSYRRDTFKGVLNNSLSLRGPPRVHIKTRPKWPPCSDFILENYRSDDTKSIIL
jgi:hypothetical protein